MHDLLARQLNGQWPAHGLGRSGRRRAQRGRQGRRSRFEVLDGELELGDLAVELLGGAPVARALQHRDLEAQLLVEQLLGDQRRADRRRLVVRRDEEALEPLNVSG